MAEKGNKPIKEFKAGTVRAAIWKEDREDAGRQTVRFSVKIEKRYFDEASKDWRNTDYFFANDLPRLRLVAERAFEFIALRETDKATDRPAPARQARSKGVLASRVTRHEWSDTNPRWASRRPLELHFPPWTVDRGGGRQVPPLGQRSKSGAHATILPRARLAPSHSHRPTPVLPSGRIGGISR